MTVVTEGADRLAPAPQRGRLTTERRVVEKIAAQAASEVAGAGGSSGGVLGVGARHNFEAPPDVTVNLHGATATISVTCGLHYPEPLRETAQAVRQHITKRLLELADIRVQRVDIEIDWLARDGADQRQLS